QAIASSFSPLATDALIRSSKAPPLMMSEMMIGLDVAPVAPSLRFVSTSLGSIESSQTFVPQAISDLSDMGGSSLLQWFAGRDRALPGKIVAGRRRRSATGRCERREV